MDFCYRGNWLHENNNVCAQPLSAHFGLKSRGQNQRNHKQSSEAERKFAFKLQICFHNTAAQHLFLIFSWSRFLPSHCLLHLCNVKKSGGDGKCETDTGLVLTLKAHVFTQNLWHCEWGIGAGDEALRWMLKHCHKVCNFIATLYFHHARHLSTQIWKCLLNVKKKGRTDETTSIAW